MEKILSSLKEYVQIHNVNWYMVWLILGEEHDLSVDYEVK